MNGNGPAIAVEAVEGSVNEGRVRSSGATPTREREESTTAAADLVAAMTARGLTLAVAESLTGGALCGRIVDVPGASAVLRGGVCTYATAAKHEVLGVDAALLAEHGPVHEDVAKQMAEGVARLFGADLTLATTGVAGPGSADGHEAGTVIIGCRYAGRTVVDTHNFDGDRARVRAASVEAALTLAARVLDMPGLHRADYTAPR